MGLKQVHSPVCAVSRSVCYCPNPAVEGDGIVRPQRRDAGVVAAIGENDDPRKGLTVELTDDIDESVSYPGLVLGRVGHSPLAGSD